MYMPALFEQLEKKRNHFKILSMDVTSTNFCEMKYLKNEISLICNQPCQIMDMQLGGADNLTFNFVLGKVSNSLYQRFYFFN